MLNQMSPEFTFTNMTLRERLQLIGGFIHAEPRLTQKCTTWVFDRYGEPKIATYRQNKDGAVKPLHDHPYKAKRHVYDIGVACTEIESNADNFVNRLDKIGGTVTEPYLNGALSLRSDTAYLRLEDKEIGAEGLHFPTHEPIMDVTAFRWVDLEGFAGAAGMRYDVTPYIFEKTIYNAELSSYVAQYPRSKCYGLYFTQGQKGIFGFFFKNSEWSDGVFANYAVTNILRQATGKSNLNLSDKYPKLCFELTYTPMYGARLRHGKSYTGDMLKKPFSLAYNQSANVVETRYYGEHIKGVAERLGNMEKTVSIFMRNAGNIPKIGEMWDEDYYISSVKGSVVLDGINLELGLSKKFNRLSEYVGANSYKRYYEVSERMAQERRTLYKDYLVITKKSGGPIQRDCLIQKKMLSSVANTFYQTDGSLYNPQGATEGTFVTNIASCVLVGSYSKNRTEQSSVLLPVISSAFGNEMEFTWSFKDNYSAGTSVVRRTSDDGKVSGYFGAEVTYGDYYGRAYYQRFWLQYMDARYLNLEIALGFPKSSNKLWAESVAYCHTNCYIELRKDNREALSQAYAIEFVTDVKNLIIGSALARNNPCISGLNEKASAELYILPERINRFSTSKINLDGATLIHSYTNMPDANRKITLNINGGVWLVFEGTVSPVSGQAWAIVTKSYEGEPYAVENEDRETELLTPQYGGELLIGQNNEVRAGDTVGEFNVVPTHNIFDFVK